MNQGKNQLLGHNWIPDCITSATWMYPCVITLGTLYQAQNTYMYIVAPTKVLATIMFDLPYDTGP